MNYAQAKRAVAARFGDHAIVEHALREKKDIQYRVFLKMTLRPPVCIGAGSSWRRAVEMAMKAEVTRTPAVEPPTQVVVPKEGSVSLPASESQAEARVMAAVEAPQGQNVMGPGAVLGAAVTESKLPAPGLEADAWRHLAEAEVRRLAGLGTFTSDDVWATFDDRGLARPADSRALGQVMQKLKREGLIKPTGETVPTKQKSRHRAPIAVWVGTPG